MLNIIIDQVKAESIKNAIIQKTTVYHTFDVEFSGKDMSHNKNLKSLIGIMITEGKIEDIALAIERTKNSGNFRRGNLAFYEMEEIKNIILSGYTQANEHNSVYTTLNYYQ